MCQLRAPPPAWLRLCRHKRLPASLAWATRCGLRALPHRRSPAAAECRNVFMHLGSQPRVLHVALVHPLAEEGLRPAGQREPGGHPRYGRADDCTQAQRAHRERCGGEARQRGGGGQGQGGIEGGRYWLAHQGAELKPLFSGSGSSVWYCKIPPVVPQSLPRFSWSPPRSPSRYDRDPPDRLPSALALGGRTGTGLEGRRANGRGSGAPKQALCQGKPRTSTPRLQEERPAGARSMASRSLLVYPCATRG